MPSCAWTVLSAGEGSQGPRLYEWAWFQLPEVCQEVAGTGQARFVLLRRSLSDPSQRAYYRVAGPATLTLAEVVRIAGRRWTIEEAIEEARMRGGLGSVGSAHLWGLVPVHDVGPLCARDPLRGAPPGARKKARMSPPVST